MFKMKRRKFLGYLAGVLGMGAVVGRGKPASAGFGLSSPPTPPCTRWGGTGMVDAKVPDLREMVRMRCPECGPSLADERLRQLKYQRWLDQFNAEIRAYDRLIGGYGNNEGP